MSSKNRFIAVQFQAILKDGLWKDIAAHTNALAKTFESMLAETPGIKIVYPVESNAIFIELSASLQTTLTQQAGFYLWDESKNICRFMFSFDNTIEEIKTFTRQLQNAIGT